MKILAWWNLVSLVGKEFMRLRGERCYDHVITVMGLVTDWLPDRAALCFRWGPIETELAEVDKKHFLKSKGVIGDMGGLAAEAGGGRAS